ncbi:copper amine oxidase N-terminal domain-containing protein [Inediibacterium massiliense]|uniref:copper amine oxidase N-terminal domain-containing protein n=1 Tax=Inediibacterium massiliense TaxID=1658111 RepID=UPI0006B559BA|nr:copper amine oxidase N-terminal domain-containing protein [Inediibacterium massiliense]
MKYKQLITGLVIGSMLGAGASVFAQGSLVPAQIADYISFTFNGKHKALDSEYTVLMYKDRTYVPARFIAENLGAQVKWDDGMKIISIVKEEPKEEVKKTDKEEPKEEPKKEEDKKSEDKKEEQKEEKKSSIDYKKLPISQTIGDVWISVTGISIDEDDKVASVYIKVENKASTPVQIDQRSAKIIAGDKTYKQEDVRAIYDIDPTWFNDIKKDDEINGVIKMPIPTKKDEPWKNITLTFKLRQNDGTQKETELKFDIAL